MFVTDKVKEDLDEEDIILVEATGTMIWDQEGTRGYTWWGKKPMIWRIILLF